MRRGRRGGVGEVGGLGECGRENGMENGSGKFLSDEYR